MARNKTIKVLRTTRAALNSNASAGNLLAGEPYFITDENRIAIGISATAYETYAKETEAGVLSAADYLASASKVNGIFRNGSCQDGTNSNYTALDFSDFKPPPNTRGFFTKTGYAGVSACNDYLPITTTQVYMLSADVRQRVRSANTRLYLGILQYDVDDNLISAMNCSFVAGTKTTLAAPLAGGDTTVTLTSSANWISTATDWWEKSISFYNYVDSKGFEYDHVTNPYTRNIFRPDGVGAWLDGGISGNVITLSIPFNLPNPAAGSGGVWPVGTVVSNTSEGGSYNYRLASWLSLTDTDWHNLKAFIGGGIDASGQQDASKFRAGIAKAKFFGLYNYGGSSSDVVDITNIFVKETPLITSTAPYF